MTTNDTNIVLPKRKRGRPTKAEQAAYAAAAAARLRSVANAVKRKQAKAATVASSEILPFNKADYDGTLVALLDKGKPNEKLAIGHRTSKWRNREYSYVDIRTFFFSHENAKWLPTKKGVSIQTKDQVAFIEAIANAFANA